MTFKPYYYFLALFLFVACQQTKEQSKENTPIVFTDKNGNEITFEELKKSDGSFDYSILGTTEISEQAKSLHNEARSLGQQGNYDSSIGKLNKAIEIAPKWAYPVYDLAYTYLLQDDYDKALKYYQLTDSLEPRGYFTTKVAVYTLQKEHSGELPKGLYKNYLMLEWIDNPEEKKKMLQQLVSSFPNYAPALADYANLFDGTERIEYLEQGLASNPDNQTKGTLLINKALYLSNSNKYKEAISILTDLIFNSETTYGNIELAKLVLRNISDEKKDIQQHL